MYKQQTYLCDIPDEIVVANALFHSFVVSHGAVT